MLIEMSKGFQLTIPAEIRAKQGLEPGTKFEVEETTEGILLRPLNQSMEDFWKELDAKGLPSCTMTLEELDDFSDLY